MKQRHTGVRKERKATLRRLKKYQKFDFTLNCDQQDELLAAVATITEQCPQDLQKVLSEAEAQGKGEIMRKLWKLDVDDRLAFKQDQTKNCKSLTCTCV